MLWEAFDFKNDFTVRYVVPDGIVHDISVVGITMNEIWELGESEGSSENYSYRTFPDKNICILEFNSFNNLAKFDRACLNFIELS